MSHTKIQWTNETLNIVTGCTKISEGCVNCYAEIMHRRLTAMGQEKYSEPFHTVCFNLEELFKIEKWKKPRMVFVNSMSDTFHDKIYDCELNYMFQSFGEASKHTFQILTKRPQRALEYFKKIQTKFPDTFPNLMQNIWLGVTVENNKEAWRIETLKEIPAKTRFLSIEPLLEDMKQLDLSNIDWVIVGCESGAKKRECKPEWIFNIILQCKAQNVPVFVKQVNINGKVLKENLPENYNFREFPI